MSEMNLMLGRTLAQLKKMSPAEKIQTLVKAGRMTQEEADRAKQRLHENAAPNPTVEAEQPNP